MQIARDAEQRTKPFIEQVRGESRNVRIGEPAPEFAPGEALHLAWAKDALARLPKPFQPSEEQAG